MTNWGRGWDLWVADHCVTVDVFPFGLQGDFTWNSMSGRSVRLRSVPIQSLSELERARLQEVAFYQLQQDCDLSCQITIPKGKAPFCHSVGDVAKQKLCQSYKLQIHLSPATDPRRSFLLPSFWVIGWHWGLVGKMFSIGQFTFQLICLLKRRLTWSIKGESHMHLNSLLGFSTTS